MEKRMGMLEAVQGVEPRKSNLQSLHHTAGFAGLSRLSERNHRYM